MFSAEWFTALGSVIVIDLVMSGDNAIIVGLAAAGLPPQLRRKAIVVGVAAATVLRIFFALITFQLLQIIGLTLAGGLLLLWVSWKMWRDIRQRNAEQRKQAGEEVSEQSRGSKTFRQALIAIVIADVSMALDNILGVAGAAHDHIEVLVFGLVLSIALMAVAANYIAKLIERHNWIGYVGLVVIAWVAVDMIVRGYSEVAAATTV
ncbi:MAG: TerC family protein [Alphaproteobacteria bacterium]|mgnify:CR=1 FL=1|nr:TerC family protein [Alphaproteobacteria bacterium]MDP6623065.1 TerC family protein [Alphaproteobacteria bacterium]